MLEGLAHLFAARPLTEVLIDLADLAIVAWVVYRALLVLRGTRAMQMGLGLGVIGLVYLAAKLTRLITLFNLLSTLLSSILLIVVVVFQNDIRRGLIRVGARAFLTGSSRRQESKVIEEVVMAATELARARVGALICFEQEASLDEFVVGQGTEIDAVVQRDLLVSIFLPEPHNKLHDGAVLIRNLRIANAGVFFPMPDTKVLDKSMGTRHRAALGITEETDAVVVVVSEERGTISYCFNGNIVSNLDGVSLRQVLLGHFGGQRVRKRKAGAPKSARQTGSFRISLPPPSPPMSQNPGSTPPPPGATPVGPLAVPTPIGSLEPSVLQRRTMPLTAARVEVPPPRPIAPAKPIEAKATKPISTPPLPPAAEGTEEP